MSNYQELTPESEQYLTNFDTFNQVTFNQEDLTLPSTMTADPTPTVSLNGSGGALLQGQITVNTASVTANMLIANLPTKLTPQTDTYHPVVVLRSNVLVSNAVKVESGGSGVTGVTISNAGVYESIPTLSAGSPGIGATFTAKVKAVALTVQTAQSSTGSYAPGDTLTGTGGTATTQFTVPITHTKVVGTPTVAAAGASGTPGSATVTGTTGTGTKFQATVTISGGGAISSVDSLTVAGDYTVNPTLLTAEPVTGGGLVGATLAIHMGVLTLGTISVAGSYTVIPTDPITTTSSGSGTGCTLNAQWGLLAPTVTNAGSGYDTTSAFVVTGGSEVTPAVGTLVLGDDSNGRILLLTAPNQNDVVCLDSVSFLVDSYK